MSKTHIRKMTWAFICLLILIPACNENQVNDSSKPLWEAQWSYTPGNELLDYNLYSSTAHWSTALKDETNYNFKPYSLDQNDVPSDTSLDWSSPQIFLTTAGDFLRSFYANARIGGMDADRGSFFFGVNTPPGTAANDYSVTLAKGSVESVYGVALSLVFKTKIHSIAGLTAEQKWRLTQYNIIHELGHARGLNAGSYDHITHNGSNWDICVMRVNVSANIPLNHVFCAYHKKVLRDCLTLIQNTYDPNSSCASFP